MEVHVLRERGAAERLEGTIVSKGDPAVTALDATACLQVVAAGDGILRSVAVREDLRGKGLGMLAVATAVRHARGLGVHTISLFTEGAASFFERLGFVRVERSALPEPVRIGRHAAEECAVSATPMLLTFP